MQKRILVVDDNRDLADGLAMILEDEGYAVALAYDGSSACSMLETGNIDAAFIDIKLPDISGLRILSRIKAGHAAMPVMLMTGYRIEQVLESACGGRPVTVLRSPIKRDKLLQRLHEKAGGVILAENTEAGFITGLQVAVEEAGSSCMLVSDGKSMEDAVRAQAEVMLLDLQTTVVSGLTDFLHIKERWPGGTLVMVMGARQQRNKVTDPLSSPELTGCLYKPFKPEFLVEILKTLHL